MKPRQIVQVREEVTRLQGVLGSRPAGYKVRATTAVTRSLLLHGWFFYDGRRCNPVAKSIGAGVYEIWLEEAA